MIRPIFELQIEDFEHASCFHKQVLQKIPISEKTKDKFQKKLFRSLHYIYLANQQTIRQPIKSVDNFFLIRLKKKFDFLNFSKKWKNTHFNACWPPFDFCTDFFQRLQKNFAGGQFSLCVWLRARLIYEVCISQIKLRRKVPRFF